MGYCLVKIKVNSSLSSPSIFVLHEFQSVLFIFDVIDNIINGNFFVFIRFIKSLLESLEILNEFFDDFKLNIRLLLKFWKVAEVLSRRIVFERILCDQGSTFLCNSFKHIVYGHQNLAMLRCLLESIVGVFFIVSSHLCLFRLEIFQFFLFLSDHVIIAHNFDSHSFDILFHFLAYLLRFVVFFVSFLPQQFV